MTPWEQLMLFIQGWNAGIRQADLATVRNGTYENFIRGYQAAQSAHQGMRQNHADLNYLLGWQAGARMNAAASPDPVYRQGWADGQAVRTEAFHAEHDRLGAPPLNILRTPPA